MTSERLLGMVVVVLAVACAALGYRLWIDQTRLAAMQASGMSTPHESTADGQGAALVVRSSPTALSEAANAPPTDLAPAADTASSSKPLGDLPSWLPIPDGKRELLARLQQVQGVRSYYGVANDPAARARADAAERTAEEYRRQAALQAERLLGPELYLLWKEYQDTYEAREQIARLNAMPGVEKLSEDRARALAWAMSEAARGAESGIPDYLSPVTVQDVEWKAEQTRRKAELMRLAASRHLSSSQLKAFDELQAEVAQARQRSDAQYKAYLEAGSSNGGDEGR